MPLSEHVYCVAFAFKMTEWVEQQICIKFCIKLEQSSVETIHIDSEGFWGWCNECSSNKSVAQTLQRWLRMCWKRSMFWKAWNKRNTWECWTCTGCNQQRSATDSARTRSSSGDPKIYCVWDFDAESWHGMCHGKICSTASATRAKAASCCSWENCMRSHSAHCEGDWGIIVLCRVFLISCIFLNKCLFL